MTATTSPPELPALLPPLLASLPAALVSPTPPPALLPLLSPILRQRVQLLSTSTNDPWLPLLSYSASTPTLTEHVTRTAAAFEPHPVSGDIEVEDAQVRFRRVDQETLQAAVELAELGLNVRLVWCTGDAEGGGDGSGWRVGEVNVLGAQQEREGHEGWQSVAEAERAFTSGETQSSNPHGASASVAVPASNIPEDDEDDDDDAYWAQYDNTPARTPAVPRSRSPAHAKPQKSGLSSTTNAAEDEAYYAQYAQVQPALDNHDPDEARENGDVQSTLGDNELTDGLRRELNGKSTHHEYRMPSEQTWSEQQNAQEPPPYTDGVAVADAEIIQPRPRASSSNGSSGDVTIAKLEGKAEAQRVSDVGVTQHIGTTVKSLFRLARSVGMEKTEFERLVRRELDCLALMEEE